jgi:hypothetical protein
MNAAVATTAHRGFLWAAWVFAAWFVIAVTIFKLGSALADALYIPIVLSGAGVALGAVSATVYLFGGIWLPTRWYVGALALVADAAFLWLYYQALP